MSREKPHVEMEDKEKMVQNMIRSGMPPERAHVYVRRACFGMPANEVADELGKATGTVTNYHSRAVDEVSKAGELWHYAGYPRYISRISPEIIEGADISNGVGFTLHCPKIVGDEYSLVDSQVIEGVILDDDCLVRYYSPTISGGNDSTEYYCLGTKFLIRFIHDWVISNRFSGRISYGPVDPSEYAETWFLTYGVEPEWLEEKLETRNIDRVEILTDDRFRNPIEDERVRVSETATTAITYDGYTVGYRPTAFEVAQLLTAGEITEEIAEKVTLMSPDQLEQLL